MYKLVGVRMAENISDIERDTCDRYGEQVIATMLAGGLTPRPEDLAALYQTDETRNRARDWLTERADIRDWRERWVSGRDFLLEIVVIFLIGWELVLARRQDIMQDQNFKRQQEVLTNLANSSRDTASILASLKTTTETMNGNIVTLRGPVERNAIAAEASSATATKSMHVSERAYIACAFSLSSPPKGGEKWSVNIALTNAGRTNAVELVSWAAVLVVAKGTDEKVARQQAFLTPLPRPPSKTVLTAGQQLGQVVETMTPLTDEMVDGIDAGRFVGYVFLDVNYKDVFDRRHRTEQCGFYLPSTKQIAGCSSLTKAD